LEIKKTQCEGRTVLAISGRLDTNTSPELQETLLSEMKVAKLVTLDFAALTYISSSGLRVLLIGTKTARAKGCGLILTNISAEVREILDMTGFTDILEIE
jgi:anti-anti-sigma factor